MYVYCKGNKVYSLGFQYDVIRDLNCRWDIVKLVEVLKFKICNGDMYVVGYDY